MNLTAYSDSESDNDAPPASKPLAKAAPRPSFQKVVDRSNPGRIKVNLPGTIQQNAPKDNIGASAPPAKKARLGGGGLSGFNAMLPAPKKTGASANTSTSGTGSTSIKRGLGKGLGGGVNLKTGAEPAFQREPRIEMDEYDENGNLIQKEPMKKEDFRAMLNLPPPKTDSKTQPPPNSQLDSPLKEEQKTEPLPKPRPATPRFVPMSVGKGKKKKSAVLRSAVPKTDNNAQDAVNQVSQTVSQEANSTPRKAKVSLFGVSNESESVAEGGPQEEYKPLLYDAEDQNEEGDANEIHMTQPASYPPQPSAPISNNLAGIASDLNLSEAERRQLFGKRGRGGPDLSGARIVEFNTDTEYAHNETLRQQGEQVQHNALKSITGTGKNSLRSLVNVAATQKDALEEHFAAGYRNKKEAGNRYGW